MLYIQYEQSGVNTFFEKIIIIQMRGIIIRVFSIGIVVNYTKKYSAVGVQGEVVCD